MVGSLASKSGRRQGHPCRPPTPPDVPFGIRRFMKQTGSAAEFPAAKPAPYGRTRTWDRRGSCETRRHSTMGHAHWWLIATLALYLSQPSSDSEPVGKHASIAARAGRSEERRVGKECRS